MLDVKFSSEIHENFLVVFASHNYDPDNLTKLCYKFVSGSGRIYVPTLEKREAPVDTSDKKYTIDPTVKEINLEDTSLALFYWVRTLPFNEEDFVLPTFKNYKTYEIYFQLGSLSKNQINFALIGLVLPVKGYGVAWHRELWQQMNSALSLDIVEKKSKETAKST